MTYYVKKDGEIIAAYSDYALADLHAERIGGTVSTSDSRYGAWNTPRI